jgi:hypothetical protein
MIRLVALITASLAAAWAAAETVHRILLKRLWKNQND